MKKELEFHSNLWLRKKIVRIMKLTTLFILAIVLNVNAKGFSQNSKLNLILNSGSLEDALKQIEEQSDYYFYYNKEDINDVDEVSVNADDEEIQDVLDQLLSDTDLEFRMIDQYIVIKQKDVSDKTQINNQQNAVTGKVTDSYGAPLPGVTVIVKGTTNGTVTDIDGVYTLSNLPDNTTLQFSFIGMQTFDVLVEGKSTLNITMHEDTININEVVAIGYGTVKKSDLTGSVSSISSKDFKDQPVTRVEEALQGRMAGVDVKTVSGAPGGEVKIRIRGASSVNKTNDPLYVVDGIYRENGLNGINVSDISSIEVLKDASSTAIYGSRGSNGVVLITTKKGIVGKQITFEMETGISTIAKKYDLLNAYDYALALNELNGVGVSDEDLIAYKKGEKGIDWQDKILQTGVTQSYKLAFSGGNENTQFYISANVLDQKGISIESKYRRYQFRTNVNSDITDWFKLNSDVNFARTNEANNKIHVGGKSNIFWSALSYSPTMELYDEESETYNSDPYNSLNDSPYGILKENDDDRINYYVNSNLNLIFSLSKGLSLSIQGGLDYNDYKEYTFESKKVSPGATNSMSNSDIQRFSWQSTNNLTYANKWNDHSFTGMIVYECGASNTRNMEISGTNLLTETVGYWNVDLATTTDQSNSYSEYSIQSLLSRVMYNFKEKYFLTATIRADGSSKFQGDNKWGYFPSVAIAWNMANEEFMKDQDLFSYFKIRASFGVTGSQAINPYGTLGLMTGTTYSYGTENLYTGYWADSFSNQDLTWEKNYQYDLGLDFAILRGKISFNLDYFYKKTKDLLLQKTIPDYDGGGYMWVNQGQVNNTGVEFLVNANIINKKNLNWKTTLNATYLKNEIINLGGDEIILGTSPADGLVPAVSALVPGESIGSFYGYIWEGLDENGDNTYRDINNSGTFDSGDKTIIGKATPDITLGLNNTITYKNWEVNLFFNMALGADMLNLTRFTTSCAVGDSRFITLKDAYYNNFDKIGQKSHYASLTSETNSNYGESTQWLESADFLRLRNLSLAYNLSKSLTKIADLRLSVSCQNVFTITGYSGMDPESSTSNGDDSNADVDAGMDVGAYPSPRIFTFGIRVDF